MRRLAGKTISSLSSLNALLISDTLKENPIQLPMSTLVRLSRRHQRSSMISQLLRQYLPLTRRLLQQPIINGPSRQPSSSSHQQSTGPLSINLLTPVLTLPSEDTALSTSTSVLSSAAAAGPTSSASSASTDGQTLLNRC